MNLSEISWPVFRLGEMQPTIVGSVVFYSREYEDKELGTPKIGFRVVDDTEVEGATLGLRRLKLKSMDVRLFPVRRAIYFLADLIKISNATTWFIDSAGKTFQYRRSIRAKLTCHKIKKILPLNGMGAIVELDGIPTRFKSMYSPYPGQIYAGVLQWGNGHILYGYYGDPFKPSYRKV